MYRWTPAARSLDETWNRQGMIRFKAILLLALFGAMFGCEGLPQEKPLDQGKVDRAMEQIEKGQE